jgi:hypothetical protein
MNDNGKLGELFFMKLLSENYKKLMMKQISTDMENAKKQEILYNRQNKIEDKILEKAMKITHTLFNMEDEKEPKSLSKFGYRDYLTFQSKLEDTHYFKEYAR